MNNIKVPDNYKHLVRPQRKTTDDYKAQIRRFIEDNPNRAIRGDEFQELLGTTSAMAHVKRLIRHGYVSRKQVNAGRGKRYTYKWHEMPLGVKEAILKNGQVHTTEHNIPELPISEEALDKLKDLFTEWVDTLPQPINGDHVAGVILFRRWLNQRVKETKVEREKAINALTHNNSTSSSIHE